MLYRQDISACLSTTIGDRGASETAFNDALAAAHEALDWLRAELDGGTLPAFDVCRQTADLADLSDLAEGFRKNCDTVAVLGTGGSSLGGQALCALSTNRAAPRMRFLDNIDPHTLDRLFDDAASERLGLVIISKSGGTAETLAQALTLVPRLGPGAHKRAVVVTEPGDTPLRRVATHWKLATRDHDPGIGGRYAACSLVGLLPGARWRGRNADAGLIGGPRRRCTGGGRRRGVSGAKSGAEYRYFGVDAL
jgi:glucose-6-phosphate isomerase